MMKYDVIVVGARAAGSSTAMLLARQGYRVLAVDRATFPSDTLSTHYLQSPGMALMKKWGLADKLAAVADPIYSLTFDLDGLVLGGFAANGPTHSDGTRRISLDKILVDAARESGAEVREGFSVADFVTEDGSIVGIRGRGENGAEVTETASIVIGADGRHSKLARAVDAEHYNEVPALSFTYYSYFADLDAGNAFTVHGRGDRVIGVQPTDHGQVLVFALGPADQFSEFRNDIEGNFMEALGRVEGLREKVADATRIEKFRGSVDVANFFRKPYGRGWALVGDAGHAHDPTLAHGIAGAFRDADLLTSAIDDVFNGRAAYDEAMAGYQRRRDEKAMPLYEVITAIASFQPPPPEEMEIVAALPGNQAQIDRWLGVMCGTVSPEDFYSPANVAAILGRELAVAA
jgi:flavin-dependent dehydrogenase